MNVFDCSNSSYRHSHRGSGGPFENDVMRQLRKYSADIKFTHDINVADVVITNDVFTPDALSRNVPLVKRMDGIFFQAAFGDRNHLLNTAAEQADVVVFISEFSKQALIELYPSVKVKNSVVALNAADPHDFYPSNHSREGVFVWGATSTRWDRLEKRLDAIIKLAVLYPKDIIFLIGDAVPNDLPKNVINVGYLDTVELNGVLQLCDAYFHPAYRDAAPKTVAQALSCGIPVLAANSGGLPELVSKFGVLIEEEPSMDEIPPISFEKLEIAACSFINQYGMIKASMQEFPSVDRFASMIDVYMNAIRTV